eukprot:GHVS01070149.1.p1 GENE.GHVS01070149.1~~GHVS01070149.1.p1  ORF type:complete len:262 (-),score=46.30 GHVS01070149.1:330-1001(-)
MAMNIFRFCGDMLHLVSIFFLLWKLKKSKNCVGVSCKMQELYALVFCCRYIDLLTHFVSIYNSTMKVIFISSTFYLIYLIRYKKPICATYDPNADCFPYYKYVLPPVLLLTIFTCTDYKTSEFLWTYSIWLESVAIIPQLVLLQHVREVENLTSHYVAAMGGYRALYIANWIFRYTHESPPYINWVVWLGGLIQTCLYVDFFYYYALAKWYGQKLVLPFSGEV